MTNRCLAIRAEAYAWAILLASVLVSRETKQLAFRPKEFLHSHNSGEPGLLADAAHSAIRELSAGFVGKSFIFQKLQAMFGNDLG